MNNQNISYQNSVVQPTQVSNINGSESANVSRQTVPHGRQAKILLLVLSVFFLIAGSISVVMYLRSTKSQNDTSVADTNTPGLILSSSKSTLEVGDTFTATISLGSVNNINAVAIRLGVSDGLTIKNFTRGSDTNLLFIPTCFSSVDFSSDSLCIDVGRIGGFSQGNEIGELEVEVTGNASSYSFEWEAGTQLAGDDSNVTDITQTALTLASNNSTDEEPPINQNPAIAIDKSIREERVGSFVNSITIEEGSGVQAKIVVTNTGDSTLTNVIVNDDLNAACDRTFDQFPVGEVQTIFCFTENVTTNISSVVTANSDQTAEIQDSVQIQVTPVVADDPHDQVTDNSNDTPQTESEGTNSTDPTQNTNNSGEIDNTTNAASDSDILPETGLLDEVENYGIIIGGIMILCGGGIMYFYFQRRRLE